MHVESQTVAPSSPLPIVLATVYGAVAALQLWLGPHSLTLTVAAVVAAVSAAAIGSLSVAAATTRTALLVRLALPLGALATLVIGIGSAWLQ